jgi:hypothetical protein
LHYYRRIEIVHLPQLEEENFMQNIQALLASSNDDALAASGVVDCAFPQAGANAVSFKAQAES